MFKSAVLIEVFFCSFPKAFALCNRSLMQVQCNLNMSMVCYNKDCKYSEQNHQHRQFVSIMYVEKVLLPCPLCLSANFTSP